MARGRGFDFGWIKRSLNVACVIATVLMSCPASAQDRGGVMGELVRDVEAIETKIIGLANAMPESAYSWRPAKGVRSTGEVLQHIAGDNYFLPALMGTPAPPDTGIDGKDNKTVGAFEARTLTRDQIVAELATSFGFLKRAMKDTPDSTLDDRPRNSKRDRTTRATWIAAVTHLHEHLGQLIAYARSNNVTPPWSK